MRQLESILIVLLFGLAVGCARPPKNLATITGTPLGKLVASVQQDTTAPAQMPEPTASLALTVASSPLQTPGPIPPTPMSPPFALIEGTSIPAASLVICAPHAAFINCYDDLLDMSFSYPSFMGAIRETELRQGAGSGYGYEYYFEQNRENAYAGGRSRDFRAARESSYTDQYGFDDRTQEELCARRQAGICREIRPGVLFTVSFPNSGWFCEESRFFTNTPRVIIMIDLPQHPLIQGFGFTSSILSPEAEIKLQNERACDTTSRANYDGQMDKMRLTLEIGTADADVQMRYDAMVRLAQSIQSSFLGNSLDAQPASQ